MPSFRILALCACLAPAGPALSLTCLAPEAQARLDARNATLVLRGRAELVPEAETPAPGAPQAAPQAPSPPAPAPAARPPARDPAGGVFDAREAGQGDVIALDAPVLPRSVARPVRIEVAETLRGAAPGPAFEAVVIEGPCADWLPDGAEAVLLLRPRPEGGWLLLGEETRP